MEAAAIARKLKDLAEFRFYSGALQWRDSPGKEWRPISRFDARLFMQILGCKEWSRLQQAMAYVADSSKTLSSDYPQKKVNR